MKIPQDVAKVDDECRFYLLFLTMTENHNEVPMVLVRMLRMEGSSVRHMIVQKGVRMPRYACSLCENHIPLSAQYALVAGGRLLRALNCMHDCGYLHGDVEPGNVFVDHTGAVKLVEGGELNDKIASEVV